MRSSFVERARNGVEIESPAQFATFTRRLWFSMETQFERRATDARCRMSAISAGKFLACETAYGGDIKACVRRSWAEIRADNAQLYLFWFPLKGACVITQNGQHAVVGEDCFAVTRSDTPFRISAHHGDDREHRSLHLALPAHLANSLMPDVSKRVGRCIDISSDAARIARGTLQMLVANAPSIGNGLGEALAMTALRGIADHLVHDGKLVSEEMSHALWIKDILAYIDRHISDQDLSMSKVASAIGISRGYIHTIMRQANVSIHDYIWEKRFQLARDKICNSDFAHESISHIAFMQGFKSSAHFSRGFRERFGSSPREIRKQRLLDT